MVDKKKNTLKKQRLNGGGLGSSKQKQPDVTDDAIENKITKPNNRVRFTSDVSTRRSYDDEYDISNISEEEPVSDNYKTKSKKRKKQWSKKRVNKSGRSIDMNNRRTLNKLKINRMMLGLTSTCGILVAEKPALAITRSWSIILPERL